MRKFGKFVVFKSKTTIFLKRNDEELSIIDLFVTIFNLIFF